MIGDSDRDITSVPVSHLCVPVFLFTMGWEDETPVTIVTSVSQVLNIIDEVTRADPCHGDQWSVSAPVSSHCHLYSVCGLLGDRVSKKSTLTIPPPYNKSILCRL